MQKASLGKRRYFCKLAIYKQPKPKKKHKKDTTEHPRGPLKEPAQHGGLAGPVLTLHRDDIARCILVVEPEAEEAIRANERPGLGAIGEGPAKDPPTQCANLGNS